MAETKERRKAPRKPTSTSKPDNGAAAPRKPTSEQRAVPLSGSSARAEEVSAEEIRQLIAEAAYYRAKERGFQPGHELEDWVQAESEVMQRVERSR